MAPYYCSEQAQLRNVNFTVHKVRRWSASAEYCQWSIDIVVSILKSV